MTLHKQYTMEDVVKLQKEINQQTFEQFFQKPEGFIWSDDLQCYYEHQDFRFKYPLESIGEFNLKWQGWLACQQVLQNTKSYSFKIFYGEWEGSYIGEVEDVNGKYIKIK